MKEVKTYIVNAVSAKAAALEVLQSGWRGATKKLVKETFKQESSNGTTTVCVSIWNRSEFDCVEDATITAYVQVYDEALNLYQVHSDR